MLQIINAILPVFGVIFVGYWAGKIDFLGKQAATVINRFIFYITLPALLFSTTAQASPEDILRLDFVLVFLIGSLLTLPFGILACWLFLKKKSSEEVILHTMATTLGNTGYMGIPMLLSLFGNQGSVAAVIGTITVNSSLMTCGICALRIFSSHEKNQSRIKPFLEIFKMPFVLASILGMACSLLYLEVPQALINAASLLGSPTAGAALFAVGLSLSDLSLHKETMVEVAWLSVCKLVISPLLVLAICPLFPNLDPVWRNCAVLLAATPLATTVCVVSANFNTYVEESSSTVFISTLFSAITLPIFIILLGV